ncbi:30S ribosomal protein S6 [Candidatus Roizmanbacteria bacterium]|nr:30S ribosomal protein S6 [Candidatus Roizmanbacteria bacterium]
MNNYELTFLLENEEDKKALTDILGSLSANIKEEKSWGHRQLAYPVKKKHSAHYYTWHIELDKKKVSELKRKLNFNEKLLRYLLLLFPS